MSKIPPPPGRPLAPAGRRIPAPIPKAKIPLPKMKIQETPEEERIENINNQPENEPPNKQFEEAGQIMSASKDAPSSLIQTTKIDQIQVKIKKGVEEQQISKAIVKEYQTTQKVEDSLQPDSNNARESQLPNFVQSLQKNSIPVPPIPMKKAVPRAIPNATAIKKKIPPPQRNLNQPITVNPTLEVEPHKQIDQIGQPSAQNIPSSLSFPVKAQKNEESVSPIEKIEQKSEKISPIQNKSLPAKYPNQKPVEKIQKIRQIQNERVQQTLKTAYQKKGVSQIKVYPTLQEKTPLKMECSINVSQRSTQKSALSKKLQQLKRATQEMLKQEQYEENDQQQENVGSIAPSDSYYIEDVVIEASSSEKITKVQQQPVNHSSGEGIQHQAKTNPIIPIEEKGDSIQNENKNTRSVPLRVAPPPTKGAKSRAPPQFIKSPIIAAPQIPAPKQQKQQAHSKEESIQVSSQIGTKAKASEKIIQKEQLLLNKQANSSNMPSSTFHIPKIENKVTVVVEQPIQKNQVINQLLDRYHNLKNGYLKNLRQLDDLIHFQKQQEQHQIQKINSLLGELHKKNDILRKACASKSIPPPSQELQAISI